MSTSAVSNAFSKTFWWPLAVIGLALAAFIVVWTPLSAQDPADVTLEQMLTGATNVEQGGSVRLNISAAFGASETLDSNAFRVEVVGVQNFIFELPLDPGSAARQMGGASLSGMISHGVPDGGTIASTNGGWVSSAATGTYDISFAGNLWLPDDIEPGTYQVRSQLVGLPQFEAQTGIFRVMEPDIVEPTPEPGEPGPRSAAIRMEPRRTIEIPQGILSNLNSQVRAALGSNEITMLGGSSTFTGNQDGTLVLPLHGLNLSSAQTVSGPINIEAPQISLTSQNGSGEAVFDLGPGMTMRADVTLVPRTGSLNVVLSNARITFEPPAPDADLIAGGDPVVTALDSSFDVGISELPAGTAIVLVYAKDPGEFLSNPSATLGAAAQDLGGGANIHGAAFILDVTREVITNEQLGSNIVTLYVNSGWHNAQTAAGRDIRGIFKADAGNVYTEAVSCSPAGDGLVGCTVEFTGTAAGFSSYTLFATGEPEVTPTPTATPTPTPTPTPTVVPPPTPEPPVEDGNLWIIIVVVLVVLGVGGGAFFFLRRRPTPES